MAHGAVAFTDLPGTDSKISIAFGNSYFQLLADNDTNTTNIKSGALPVDNGTWAWKIAGDNKTGAYAGTAQSGDNKSNRLLPMHHIASNVVYKSDNTTFVFAAIDNTSMYNDNITIYQRDSDTGNFDAVASDNITAYITDDNSSILEIASDGGDVFIVFDNGVFISQNLQGLVYHDNGTFDYSSKVSINVDDDAAGKNEGNIDLCTTAMPNKMVIVVDNGSTGTTYSIADSDGAGFGVLTLHDNGTLESTADNVTVTGLEGILACSLSSGNDNGTYILAIAEDAATGISDNITVLQSDNLTGWTTLYNDVPTLGAITSISVAAPNGTGDVWVGISTGAEISLWHSDNGTSGGLAKVHSSVATGAVAIAHDGSAAGSGKIGISYINTNTTVDVYYE
jgi:hypothetical protein